MIHLHLLSVWRMGILERKRKQLHHDVIELVFEWMMFHLTGMAPQNSWTIMAEMKRHLFTPYDSESCDPIRSPCWCLYFVDIKGINRNGITVGRVSEISLPQFYRMAEQAWDSENSATLSFSYFTSKCFTFFLI